MNIELAKQATERDRAIANIIIKQIDGMTLIGNGAAGYAAIPNGVQIDFKLSRAYGHRSIFITLNAMDMYDIKTVRYGKNFKEYDVAEHSDIIFDQLDDIIWGDIAKSCGN
jgi:hypothetical protein